MTSTLSTFCLDKSPRMGSTSVVQNRGIYCGLPTYTQKGLKALVIGSNGISGNHMLRALSENPDRWTEVVSVSRRPATKSIGIGKNVRHVQADLLKDPTDIAKILQDSNVQPLVLNSRGPAILHYLADTQHTGIIFSSSPTFKRTLHRDLHSGPVRMRCVELTVSPTCF
jgi:hypothetical protein